MYEDEFPADVLNDLEPPPVEDLIGATAVLRAIYGGRKSDKVLDGLGWMWGKLARAVQEYPVNQLHHKPAARQREDFFKQRLFSLVPREGDYHFEVDSDGRPIMPIKQISRDDVIFRIKHAIQYVIQKHELTSFEQPLAEFDPLKGGLYHAWHYFSEDERSAPEYLVENILVRDATVVLGGPLKSLKTQIMLDLMVSLACGVPFLQKWPVPQEFNVAVISGEDSDWSLKHRVRSIALAKGIDPRTTGMLLGARGQVPNLASPEALGRISGLIESTGIDVIGIDPLYLALGPSQDASVNPNDMFAMGNFLSEFASMIQSAGATAVVTHHFVKPRSRGASRVPELTDLAHAGIGQFARQWILVNRRVAYNPTQSLHKLHLVLGGYGHSSYHAVDIDTASRPDGLQEWDVRFEVDETRDASAPPNSPGKRRRSRGDRSDAAQAELLAALASLGGRATARKLRDATHWSASKVDLMTTELVNIGKLRRVEISVACGNARTRACDGFEAVGEPAGESPAGSSGTTG
jgi:replicative DNA helicase